MKKYIKNLKEENFYSLIPNLNSQISILKSQIPNHKSQISNPKSFPSNIFCISHCNSSVYKMPEFCVRSIDYYKPVKNKVESIKMVSNGPVLKTGNLNENSGNYQKINRYQENPIHVIAVSCKTFINYPVVYHNC